MSEVRDQIQRLEARIEELTAVRERCRKFMLLSRIAIAAGGLVMLAIGFGVIRNDALPLMAAITAVIGSVVILGSNKTTAEQAAADLRAAQAHRAQLIDRIDLHVVGSRALH